MRYYVMLVFPVESNNHFPQDTQVLLLLMEPKNVCFRMKMNGQSVQSVRHIVPQELIIVGKWILTHSSRFKSSFFPIFSTFIIILVCKVLFENSKDIIDQSSREIHLETYSAMFICSYKSILFWFSEHVEDV